MAEKDQIEPFTISIPDSELADLQTRLSLARFPDSIDSAGWDYGAPLDDIQRLTHHWRDKFDWRQAETKLNEMPQYTTSIQVSSSGDHVHPPLKIHFVHQRSKNPRAIPLLFVHGWPGSFIEASKIWKKLTDPDAEGSPSFHFIAPSLPNFGFSQGSPKPKFALAQYAETCHLLMLRLGYTQYVTQGGDWGFYITRAMSLLFPNHCKATHVNMDQGSAPSWTTHPRLALQHALTPYTERERQGLRRTKWFMDEGSGYRTLQSTKPQTLGYALADSPVGLLAWIYEKLHDWTDDYLWTDDEVCTWVGIYWFSTMGPAASLRIYYESAHEWEHECEHAGRVLRDRTTSYIGGNGVKLGLSHSPKELRVLPNTWTRALGDVVFERTHDSGGHFFAYEKPEHLVADVRDMFGRNGGASGVVEGATGY
ncbi:Epoxide hydrolase 1 [Exophiala dermatitidis]|uniref:Microsomal epoxide hydrolase n=1 Tax=Exophiala dermatitidis (strain ATCC 34100 / CBS 525.76 / NIH/UT8656) TaxID=858893 RepID=H6C956_EXODN|nr:microsomal epoxide hydrolase [Exophiala dermatitidis NIH/UT8656]XP_009161095.1 microsomal epoxide hydrolase, variant [Exophiala dermatitidis NIH/UT8656]EHY60633.1 microsomal epoxide hydrolase, variant [Exophiala dermatitidis NIH/UT8656]EHY60634.1 microsomal epoxide hydrolase [Exophiala dermatitidis NIH/UT8656]